LPLPESLERERGERPSVGACKMNKIGPAHPTGRYFKYAVLALVAALAACSTGPSVSRSYEGGQMDLAGSGFKPSEQVAVQMGQGGEYTTLVLDADARGSFEINTGVAAASGADMQVNARGNMGSVAQSGGGNKGLPLQIAAGIVIVVVIVGLVAYARRRPATAPDSPAPDSPAPSDEPT